MLKRCYLITGLSIMLASHYVCAMNLDSIKDKQEETIEIQSHYELAKMRLVGSGCEQDIEKARTHFEEVIKGGITTQRKALAFIYVGMMYKLGFGVATDQSKAASYATGAWLCMSPEEEGTNGVRQLAGLLRHEYVGKKPLGIFLRYGAQLGHKEMCEVLLDRGADVNLGGGETGNTLLSWAAMKGHKEVCELLLDREAEINLGNNNGSTPLCRAAMTGHKEVCELLLDRGAEVNQVDAEGMTPLFFAAEEGYIEICELLLQHNAQVPPVEWMEKHCNSEVIRVLFDKHRK